MRCEERPLNLFDEQQNEGLLKLEYQPGRDIKKFTYQYHHNEDLLQKEPKHAQVDESLHSHRTLY